MALSNKKIREEMEKGDIIISPFIEKNLSTSSYDVTLGKYYFEEQKNTLKNDVYNPFDKSNVDKVWGVEAHIAQKAKDVLDEDLVNIDKDDLIILIKPHTTILAHTQEYIGGKNHITTMMKARSSTGRNFIEVCKCAGWGDVGYTNRWTMEITNNSQYHTIPLVVGRRIAQIIFFETGQIESDGYEKKGKYQTTESLEDLKQMWNPSMMLPKMYNDRDISKNT